jgi:DNA invertase Pin-like site-specific DNA recombinase
MGAKSVANSLVVRRTTEAARSEKASRAAQYVRMSTDHQRYSVQNQAAAIAVYAAQHNLTIVRTYGDEGRSGLRISNRSGLIDLIKDVCSGRADFDHVLVYDVSRWGRFQDIDESAHYEFLCRKAGIKIAYCAEQFDNDGSVMSSIVKNIKRVMAAEYSRELSVKVHAGACRVAGMGFRSGATPSYGLRRELVDKNGESKGSLNKGERKHLQTDRVVLRPGPRHEVRIVNRIFHQFVVERKSQAAIARQLNLEQVPNHREKPWTPWMVHYLLQNENYIGNIVYNRSSYRLRQAKRSNPSELWIRTRGAVNPIVDQGLFSKAQRIMKEHYVRLSDEKLLERLREAFNEKGRLSVSIMNGIDGLASPALYVLRFGSLRKAYSLVGYRPPRDCRYIDSKPLLKAKLAEQASDIARRIRALGASVILDARAQAMTVDGRLDVSFRIARFYHDPKRAPVWHFTRRINSPPGLIVALRLNKKNTDVRDYFLVPTSEMRRTREQLTETSRSRFAKYRASSAQGAVRSIMERVAAANRASPTRLRDRI